MLEKTQYSDASFPLRLEHYNGVSEVVTEASFSRRTTTSGPSHEGDPASEQLTVVSQGEHRGLGIEVRSCAAGGLANISPNGDIRPEGWKHSQVVACAADLCKQHGGEIKGISRDRRQNRGWNPD